MANILTKVYNSTLGIPQQLLLRLLRKMKQGDMNIFDEDGLMDMSLIPFLGILDEHENDASGADFTDSTGGALAIDIFTDPVTFMTSGLTGAGKLAVALKKAEPWSLFNSNVHQAHYTALGRMLPVTSGQSQ